MKKMLVFLLLIVLISPPMAGASAEPSFLKTFQGSLGLGESIIVGNYTLTVINFLYNAQSWPVVLFRLRDNRNFTSVTFSLSEGQGYTYGDVRVDLDYVSDADSKNPRALISVYSKPATVFYGTAHANSTFIYGPLQLSVLGFDNGTVFMRYYREGFTDYAYFGVGGHYWHGADVIVYNVTNSSARMKILVPKYLRYSIVQGTVIVIDNVSFSKVEVGAPFQLNVTVSDIGDTSARYVKVYLYSKPRLQEESGEKTLLPTVTIPTVSQELPFASYMQGPVGYTGPLPPGGIKTLHFTLITSKVLKPDVYPLYIEVEYCDENGVVKKEEFQVGIPVNNDRSPKVSITDFRTDPNPVPPGSNFTVVVKVTNTGNAPAMHVRVQLMGSKPTEEKQTYQLFPTGGGNNQEVDLYPVGRQSGLYFNEVGVNQTVSGELTFAVKDVSSNVYPLYAVITYEDENGVTYKEQVTFGVRVMGRPRLKVYVGNVWVSNGRYNFEVDVANDGKAAARGVTVEVSSRELSLFPLGEKYVGSVESLDYDSANFMILNGTLKAGTYPVNVRVTYLADNGSFVSFNKTITVQIPANLKSRGRYEYYYVGAIALILLFILLWRARRG